MAPHDAFTSGPVVSQHPRCGISLYGMGFWSTWQAYRSAHMSWISWQLDCDVPPFWANGQPKLNFSPPLPKSKEKRFGGMEAHGRHSDDSLLISISSYSISRFRASIHLGMVYLKFLHHMRPSGTENWFISTSQCNYVNSLNPTRLIHKSNYCIYTARTVCRGVSAQ